MQNVYSVLHILHTLACLTLVALRLLFPTFINRSTCRKFKYRTDTALHYPRMPVYMHLWPQKPVALKRSKR